MIDRYTKAVLTIIAAALVALVAQGAIRQSRAANDIQKVEICDHGGNCARTTNARNGRALAVREE
jgi:hypothetical protein